MKNLNFGEKIILFLLGIACIVGVTTSILIFNGHKKVSENLSQSLPQTPALFDTSLAIPQGTLDTSMTLASAALRNGSTLSGYFCFTVDSNTSLTEYECGTASSTMPTLITNLTRGVDPVNGTSSVPSLIFSHRAGADVRITDFPAISIFQQTLNGNLALPNILTYDPSIASSTFIGRLQAIPSVAYVNSIALSGSPNASTTTNGLVQFSTRSQLSSGTLQGSSGAFLVPSNNYFNSTFQAATTVPVTLGSGKLSQGFLDLTQSFTFTGAFTASNATVSIPSLVPPGAIQMYSSSTAPTGWLLANGQSVSTTTYSSLFSVIGYTFGGSGANFSLPNMGGRMPIGPSTSTPFSTTIGTTGGSTTTPLVVSGTLPVSVTSNGTSFLFGFSGAGFSATGTATTTPPFMILNFIIKY